MLSSSTGPPNSLEQAPVSVTKTEIWFKSEKNMLNKVLTSRLEMAKLWDVASLLRKLAKTESEEQRGAAPEEPPQAEGEEEEKKPEDPPVCTFKLTQV